MLVAGEALRQVVQGRCPDCQARLYYLRNTIVEWNGAKQAKHYKCPKCMSNFFVLIGEDIEKN